MQTREQRVSMLAVNNSRLLLVALAFGVFADALLRVTPWGLNLFLVVLGGIGAAALLSRWNRVDLSGEGRWLALASVFFAAALVWRDSPTLTTANSLALLVASALALLTARVGQVRRAGVARICDRRRVRGRLRVRTASHPSWCAKHPGAGSPWVVAAPSRSRRPEACSSPSRAGCAVRGACSPPPTPISRASSTTCSTSTWTIR